MIWTWTTTNKENCRVKCPDTASGGRCRCRGSSCNAWVEYSDTTHNSQWFAIYAYARNTNFGRLCSFLGDTKSVKMLMRKRLTITRDKLGFGEGHDEGNRYTSWVVVRARIIWRPHNVLKDFRSIAKILGIVCVYSWSVGPTKRSHKLFVIEVPNQYYFMESIHFIYELRTLKSIMSN